MKLFHVTYWNNAAEDDLHVERIRERYRDIYASTGGVPVSNEVTDGCYINFPDIDLMDPRWNSSGVPWHRLYYKGNYERLQKIKQRWDPHNVFRHA